MSAAAAPIKPAGFKMETIDLPLINLSSDFMGDPSRRKVEAEKLIESFSGPGFCLITGIEGYQYEEIYKWTKWFFNDVPESERFRQLAIRTMNPSNPNLVRGYRPLMPGLVAHAQIYDMGPTFDGGRKVPEGEGADNPLAEITPRLRLEGREEETGRFYEVMYRHYGMLERAGATIMSLIAEAGGERSDLFASFPTHSLIRPIKYPDRKEEKTPDAAYMPDGRVMCKSPHVDSGLVTLLQTFGFPGLEIEVDGKWFAVPPRDDGTLVVNVGEQLTGMSNGRFKSTIHRVINIGNDRYSMPFFYYPAYNANINIKIPRSLLPEKDPDEVEDGHEDYYFPFATFYLNKLPVYAEYAGILESIPQWMRKKYVEGFRSKVCWAYKTGRLGDK